MSTASDILMTIAAQAAKEAFNWAVGKVRDKAKEHGLDLSDDQLEAIVTAQLGVMFTAVSVMAASIEHDAQKLAASEDAFRNAPNVTVVESMDEPEKGE